jgi:hypothetical protein
VLRLVEKGSLGSLEEEEDFEESSLFLVLDGDGVGLGEEESVGGTNVRMRAMCAGYVSDAYLVGMTNRPAGQ